MEQIECLKYNTPQIALQAESSQAQHPSLFAPVLKLEQPVAPCLTGTTRIDFIALLPISGSLAIHLTV
jgi:hypothetical protein